VGFYLVDEEKTIRINGDQAREDTVSSMTGITNNGVVPSMPGTTSKSVISVIKDLRTGDSITLMELYGQKWAVKTSGASARQMAADGMRKMNGQAKPSSPQNSDITSMVSGYQTEIYNWTNINGVSMKFWVARDFPAYQEITGQLEKVYGLTGPDATKGWIRLDPATLPGMVMKTETKVGGTNLITTTLISAKEEPVDASAFVIPKDYQVMDSQQTH
jgi:ssDNA-binding replication factor A large subunit